jgi:hypothetical protein
MKIISSDNFGSDTVSDKLVAENVPEFYGKPIVEFLNEKFSGDYSDKYYELQSDDYELFTWEP